MAALNEEDTMWSLRRLEVLTAGRPCFAVSPLGLRTLLDWNGEASLTHGPIAEQELASKQSIFRRSPRRPLSGLALLREDFLMETLESAGTG